MRFLYIRMKNSFFIRIYFPFWHAPSLSQDLLIPLSGHAYSIFHFLACPFSLPGSPHSTFGACLFYISYFGMPLLSPGVSSFRFRGMPILYSPFWHAPSLSQDLLIPLSGHAYFIFPFLACPFSLPGSPHSTFGACLFYISLFGMSLLSPRTSSFHFRGMPILYFPFWHAPSLSQDLLIPLSGHAYFIFPFLACPFSLPGSPHSTFGACLFYILPSSDSRILLINCLTTAGSKTSNMRFLKEIASPRWIFTI